MNAVYKKMYTMSRNEAFTAFAITIAVVVAYSFWGAHVLRSQASASPQAVATLQ